MGSILGGILGGGSSPGQDAQMQGLKASQADLQAYRPEAMQARLNALSNMSTAYQGANNALQTLWGAPPSNLPADRLQGMGSIGPTMMGHPMPSPGPSQGTSPQAVATGGSHFADEYDPVMRLLDPAGIFGGR
jgi:hypothetical protein